MEWISVREYRELELSYLAGGSENCHYFRNYLMLSTKPE